MSVTIYQSPRRNITEVLNLQLVPFVFTGSKRPRRRFRNSKIVRQVSIICIAFEHNLQVLDSNCTSFSCHQSYVYWTVHHLDSWIKGDQLDVTCFIISLFNAGHVSDVNTSILRSLRLICWVISWVVLVWFDVCWCYVVVWLGWCGIRIQCFSLHTDTTPPQPNYNVTPTHIEPQQYNPWNNSTNKSQAPEDGCINIRNMLSSK